jgi:UDP-N-acetylglucosamine--N-acetylmuramyl-(pentapeptide) pyrophosphoryl-undecaprenol N-acetylglucosamine transferase
LISPIIRKIFYSKKYKSKNFFTILVIGGSQGAKIFDNTIHKAIASISKIKKIRIFHQTKKSNINYLKKFYKKYKVANKVFSYESKIIKILRGTDLCITRAGASTLFELIALNIPFITIPISNSSNNHQIENAKFYKKKNCCWILKESDLNEIFLFKKLKKILLNKNEFLNKKKNLLKLSKSFKLKKQIKVIIKELNE